MKELSCFRYNRLSNRYAGATNAVRAVVLAVVLVVTVVVVAATTTSTYADWGGCDWVESNSNAAGERLLSTYAVSPQHCVR